MKELFLSPVNFPFSRIYMCVFMLLCVCLYMYLNFCIHKIFNNSASLVWFCVSNLPETDKIMSVQFSFAYSNRFQYIIFRF